MDTILLVYIIGVIISLKASWDIMNLTKVEFITIGDTLLFLFMSSLSWLTVTIAIFICWREILNYKIWRRKDSL